MAFFDLTGTLQRWFVPQLTTLNDPQFVFFFKIFPVLADGLLIAVLYVLLRRERLLRWLIPGLLAIHPALVANSACGVPMTRSSRWLWSCPCWR